MRPAISQSVRRVSHIDSTCLNSVDDGDEGLHARVSPRHPCSLAVGLSEGLARWMLCNRTINYRINTTKSIDRKRTNRDENRQNNEAARERDLYRNETKSSAKQMRLNHWDDETK